MTAPAFHPGDEIEWRDDDDLEPRWRPGRIAYVCYEVTTDSPGELLAVPAHMVRSAPRLPLEGIEP